MRSSTSVNHAGTLTKERISNSGMGILNYKRNLRQQFAVPFNVFETMNKT